MGEFEPHQEHMGSDTDLRSGDLAITPGRIKHDSSVNRFQTPEKSTSSICDDLISASATNTSEQVWPHVACVPTPCPLLRPSQVNTGVASEDINPTGSPSMVSDFYHLERFNLQPGNCSAGPSDEAVFHSGRTKCDSNLNSADTMKKDVDLSSFLNLDTELMLAMENCNQYLSDDHINHQSLDEMVSAELGSSKIAPCIPILDANEDSGQIPEENNEWMTFATHKETAKAPFDKVNFSQQLLTDILSLLPGFPCFSYAFACSYR